MKNIRKCHGEFDGMRYDECKDYMRTKLQTLRTGITDKGYTQIKYRIGIPGSEIYKDIICRQCFQAAYNIGRSALTDMLDGFKRNEVVYSRPIGPSLPPLNVTLTAAIVSLAARRGTPLSAAQIGKYWRIIFSSFMCNISFLSLKRCLGYPIHTPA